MLGIRGQTPKYKLDTGMHLKINKYDKLLMKWFRSYMEKKGFIVTVSEIIGLNEPSKPLIIRTNGNVGL